MAGFLCPVLGRSILSWTEKRGFQANIKKREIIKTEILNFFFILQPVYKSVLFFLYYSMQIFGSLKQEEKTHFEFYIYM